MMSVCWIVRCICCCISSLDCHCYCCCRPAPATAALLRMSARTLALTATARSALSALSALGGPSGSDWNTLCDIQTQTDIAAGHASCIPSSSLLQTPQTSSRPLSLAQHAQLPSPLSLPSFPSQCAVSAHPSGGARCGCSGFVPLPLHSDTERSEIRSTSAKRTRQRGVRRPPS